MRKTIRTAVAVAVAAISLSAFAAPKPVKLTSQQLKAVTAGKISQVNGGGNEPGGEANGVPKTNPTGSEPPGQNKGPPYGK